MTRHLQDLNNDKPILTIVRQTMTGRDINPIIPGFAPDPSITFINGKFFLVTSSFHLFPGLPMYVSDDAISWKHFGKLRPHTRRVRTQVQNSG